ncbi:MAG: hypothetical protein LC733_11390, partial [Actinobacteria bacterium]|nr:hypothetical protein [Actinomycetota bacterium]
RRGVRRTGPAPQRRGVTLGLVCLVVVGSELGGALWSIVRQSDRVLAAAVCLLPAMVVGLLLTPRAEEDFRT